MKYLSGKVDGSTTKLKQLVECPYVSTDYHHSFLMYANRHIVLCFGRKKSHRHFIKYKGYRHRA
jgi:hypothetical protein